MKIKRPKRYYKVEYAIDASKKFYLAQFVADCLTLESATTAFKEAVKINGWDSGTIFVKLVETKTNRTIEQAVIGVDDIRFKLENEGEQK